MRFFFLSFIETLLRALTSVAGSLQDGGRRREAQGMSLLFVRSCFVLLLSLICTTSSHPPEQALPVDPELSSVPRQA